MKSATSTLPQRLRMMLELVRFSHTIFAMPFALLAMIMALRVPSEDGSRIQFRLLDLLGIVLCMVFARTAAMAFNRWSDREIDAENPRTANRHIPAGLLSSHAVLGLTILSSIGFVSATLLFLPNRLPLIASVPVLVFLLGYSLAKRFTAAAHVWLGIALSLAPVCAWAAIRGEMVLAYPRDILPAVVLAIAVALWVSGFDMIYACQDEAFDRKRGLHSVPARLGTRGALRVAAVLHAGMVVVLSCLPVVSPVLDLGWMYYGAVIGIAALLIYEHRLVSPNDLERVGIAFFNVNAIISAVLLVVGGLDCWT